MLFLDKAKKIYESLPGWMIAPIGLVPISSVLGKNYRTQRQFLTESDSWSKEKLLEYQQKKLFQTVHFAATTTPFYQRLFKDLGIPPQLRSIEDFYKIPVIDKETIRKAGADLYSTATPASSRYSVTTGGTSGSPLSLMMSNEAYAGEWAFVHNLLGRYGIEPSERKVGFRGVPNQASGESGRLRYNPIYRELQISPFHLTENYISSIVQQVIKFKPVYLHGYPSALEIFARIVEGMGLSVKFKLKGVLAISESLFDNQKKLIEKVFGCPVFSFYGHTERLIFASNAPNSPGFYPDPRYGFTELLNGELVGTGFINLATPLLRYRTGDNAVMSELDGKSGEYGLFQCDRIDKLEGRWRQELMVGKTGALISVTALNMHSDIFANVERFQFYQDTPGVVELRLVPLNGFVESRDAEAIRKGFFDKVGEELGLVIKVVGGVELTPRQKQLFLIQKLDLSTYGVQKIQHNKVMDHRG